VCSPWGRRSCGVCGAGVARGGVGAGRGCWWGVCQWCALVGVWRASPCVVGPVVRLAMHGHERGPCLPLRHGKGWRSGVHGPEGCCARALRVNGMRGATVCPVRVGAIEVRPMRGQRRALSARCGGPPPVNGPPCTRVPHVPRPHTRTVHPITGTGRHTWME
jgi:hypothetical protein